jgi:hypothetical protein
VVIIAQLHIGCSLSDIWGCFTFIFITLTQLSRRTVNDAVPSRYLTHTHARYVAAQYFLGRVLFKRMRFFCHAPYPSCMLSAMTVLYFQWMNIKSNEVCQIGKNATFAHVYNTLNQLHYLHRVKWGIIGRLWFVNGQRFGRKKFSYLRKNCNIFVE